MSLTILGGLFPVRTIVSTLSSMEWLGKGAFAPNHCTEGCPANEYPWFFGLSIPTPQRFEIVEPFVGQLIMQIFKREVMISNLYCCFRSISSPLLLSQTKFISNRKQCSTKKVRMPSGANISFVSFSFETNLDLKFHIFRQLQKWLSSVHQRLLDMKSCWQILKLLNRSFRDNLPYSSHHGL